MSLTKEENDMLKTFDMNLTKEIITKNKNDILQKLQLPRTKLKQFHKKLKNYRYINEPSEIKIGNYIRWINLKHLSLGEEDDKNNNDETDIKLANGGFVCDVVENANKNPNILCRNNYGTMFEVDISICLVFQKLNNHENIIMSILEYIKNE